MTSETTTCVSYEHLYVLNKYAKQYNLTITEFIFILIRFAAENEKFLFVSNRRIKYRQRRGAATWKRIHIMLKPHDYELFLDAKKLFKLSVARMIEFCIENFLFECIDNVFNKNNTDNYQYANYFFEYSNTDEIYSYHVYWGLPPEKLKKLATST